MLGFLPQVHLWQQGLPGMQFFSVHMFLHSIPQLLHLHTQGIWQPSEKMTAKNIKALILLCM